MVLEARGETMAEQLSVGHFLALGKSWRTAYIYLRMIERAEAFLETRGKTLLTADPVDVALLAETVRRSHSSRSQLRAALVASWDVLGRFDGPARAVRVPPKPRGRCRALEPEAATMLEQAAWARAEAEDDRGLAVLMGLYAALRRAEIACRRWEELEDDYRGHPAWLVVHCGKGEVTGEVPVHPLLAVMLERRRRRSGWMFPSPRGGPVSPATIWHWTVLVGRDAGLKVTTHLLRHTSLAECNDRSENLRATQEIARHSRPEITAIYTRATRRNMMAVVSMIDYGRVIGQEGTTNGYT